MPKNKHTTARSNNSASPGTATSPASAGPADEYWWREVYYHDFKSGRRVVFKDLVKKHLADPPSLFNASAWLTEEAAAWVYESVRRIPEIRSVESNPLPNFEWPPYPQLSGPERHELNVMTAGLTGARSPVIPANLPTLVNPPDYSDSLSQWRFDLRADKQPLLDAFKALLEAEQERRGFTPAIGEKGCDSHNSIDLPRPIDWRKVEWLDHRRGTTEKPLNSAQKTLKAECLKKARSYRGRVCEAFARASAMTEEIVVAIRDAPSGVIGPCTAAILPAMRAVLASETDELRVEAWVRLMLLLRPDMFCMGSGQMAPTAFSRDAQGRITGEQARLLIKRILGEKIPAHDVELLFEILAILDE